jgi:hypothetical protein
MTEKQLIEDARRVSGLVDIDDPAEAIEAMYGHGVHDEIVSLQGSEPASIVRVANWLLLTDSQGFTDAVECDTVQEAEEEVNHFARADQYMNGEWF